MQKLLDMKKMDLEFYFLMMGPTTKENGRIIWDMEKVSMSTTKDNFMKDSGRKMSLQVKEYLNQLILKYITKDNGFKEWKMGKVFNSIMMDHLIVASF